MYRPRIQRPLDDFIVRHQTQIKVGIVRSSHTTAPSRGGCGGISGTVRVIIRRESCCGHHHLPNRRWRRRVRNRRRCCPSGVGGGGAGEHRCRHYDDVGVDLDLRVRWLHKGRLELVAVDFQRCCSCWLWFGMVPFYDDDENGAPPVAARKQREASSGSTAAAAPAHRRHQPDIEI